MTNKYPDSNIKRWHITTLTNMWLWTLASCACVCGYVGFLHTGGTVLPSYVSSRRSPVWETSKSREICGRLNFYRGSVREQCQLVLFRSSYRYFSEPRASKAWPDNKPRKLKVLQRQRRRKQHLVNSNRRHMQSVMTASCH